MRKDDERTPTIATCFSKPILGVYERIPTSASYLSFHLGTPARGATILSLSLCLCRLERCSRIFLYDRIGL